ncbi:MAG: glucoamylase family protein [Anaerolineales bacterium]|nr:glucoamylase family protein [Anaerolineales bacterium]
MMKTGILISYFAERDEAREAFRKLNRKGHRRVAWVSKKSAGKIRTRDPFRLRRVFSTVLAIVLFGTLAEAVSTRLVLLAPMPGRFPEVLLPFLVGGFLGFLVNAVWMRRSRFGVERALLENHARWLVPAESAIILQGPFETLYLASDLLLKSGETPPAVFILDPHHKSVVGEDWSLGGAPLNPVQLQDHAQRLAAEHEVNPKPLRDAKLLKRLEQDLRRFQHACLELSEAYRIEHSAPPASEWLLDNEYLFESNARDVRLNLPWRFYRQLPALTSGLDQDLPRIYGLARELVSNTNLHLDQENLLAYIQAYQSVRPLSIGELWAAPQMLRAALIENLQHLARRALSELHEGEIANFWANRLITVSRRDPNQLFSILAGLTGTQPSPSPYFGVQLIDYLYDEESALVPVQAWLERTFHKSPNELSLRENARQNRNQISIGNAFNSLRYLALLDWKECFEKLSGVEQTLRQDPAGIYPQMDFTTRDRYRRAIENLHRGSGRSEDHVAQVALKMAAQADRDSGQDEVPNHVGTYLIGEKRKDLSLLIKCHETLRFRALRWAYRHHTAVYLTGLTFLSTAFVFLGLGFGLRTHTCGIQIIIAVLLFIPGSQLALEGMNYLVMRLLPPRTLPKMDFRISGIPDACRTLVIVPMMLVDQETIKAEVEKLEIRYLANKEANLLFGLFSDFKDAAQVHSEADAPLLKAMTRRIQDLNHRYGGERFFLFHRKRKWSESEQRYIGWERKRGKLEELNSLIAGTRPDSAERLVYVGDTDQLSNVRFIITLDSDTQLPHDTARRMIETLSHPLNRARFDANGQVQSGYTIIQPRVSPSLPSANASVFSRLFSDPTGIDPYTSVVSDVYQDLAGEGSYHGKGIYDVRAFDRVLSGRFPEATLLSHDLIEGAHVRVGLASDIELFDEFPQDYMSYIKRQHRWIRGDWQIAGWVMPRVPKTGGGRTPNPVSVFGRWKILDNLRRSLLPAANLVLLIFSWLISAQAGLIVTALVVTQLFFQSLLKPLTWATSGQSIRGVSIAQKAQDLLQVVVEAALLPYLAWVGLDAAGRVFYRKHVSHKRLLEWTSAQLTHGGAQAKLPIFHLSMGLASLFSVILGCTVEYLRPANFWVAGPWLMLWFLSPMIAWLLNRHPKAKTPQFTLSAKDRQFMRNVARRTWRYFTDFVTQETSWLPPDNYQVSHGNQLAMRTSPTNIGLYLVSVLSAHDFGYLTLDEVAHKLTLTMETIEKLERYEGHLLNWYDVQNLAPLQPRYVSTVDSGNLLGSLWALDSGLEALVRAPLLDGKAFAGLRDAGEVLRQVVLDEAAVGFDVRALGELLRALDTSPDRIFQTLGRLRRLETHIRKLSAAAVPSAAVQKGTADWIRLMQSQFTAWQGLADRYLVWIEILVEKTADEVAGLDPEALPAYQEALQNAPSLFDLAHGHVACIASLREIREKTPDDEVALRDWIDRVLEAFEKSRWLAGETLAQVDQLRHSVREISASMDMGFLYNAKNRLFSIGYNVSEGRLDHSFYDLLASEARLGSFVAIARGDIPVEHWFAMGRPYGAIGRRRALLSWTGTMFEYLMPLLFQRSYENSLLDQSAREAVAIQISYGAKHRAPWGISECAFGDLDLHNTYQYQAFGVPELGLKRGLADKIVVAPYATLLAVSLAPRESLRNLKRLARLGLLDDYGYYEALDYSRQSSRKSEHCVIIRAYMAHHQGMSFLALTNFLHDNSFQRHFHADPRVRALEPLLHERIPIHPPLHHISTRERVSSVAGRGEVTPSFSQFETPHTSTPRTQLLSNGRYSLMLTNAGGGYSRWGDFEITRWRSDRTRDSWGTFCYIREADSDRLWCNTYQPTGGQVEEFLTNFTLDRAVFQRIDHGIESETEVIVAPEDDVEIRRMTLINRSPSTRRLELTSYIELALAPHNADRQHPAFNKLFIQTEALPEQRALLAHRRPRGTDDPPIYVAHRFTLAQAPDKGLRFESDRRRFIGRGRTLARPMGALQEPGNSHGFVLDPILSLRQDLTLEPGERVQVSLVLAAGETREQVIVLMNKYGDPGAIDQAMDFAWDSAQLMLRLLRIQPDDARRFQQLGSHLLYPNPLLRSTANRIAENHKGQTGLWTYAISGDLPIALVAIRETRDLSLVRQMLLAHTYWHRHGLMADLVILNEEASGYDQPLNKELEQLIQSYSSNSGVDRSGGIYLLRSDLIPADDLTLLRAVASVVTVAARGALPQQLGVPPEIPDLPVTMVRKSDPRDTSAALPFLELAYFNSLGGFTPDGREYAIYLGPDMNTPAPWVNVIANPGFGAVISETGAGFTWQGNSQRNRLTSWSNDPVMDPPSEAIYIRDEETGAYWTPTASPIRERIAYRARHGAGYTAFEHNSHGIEQELTVFVPVDDQGGAPIKLQRLLLRNDSARPRKLSVTYYAEWTLGESRESSQMHVVTEWDDEVQAMIARNHYNEDNADQVAFAALSTPTEDYTGDRTAFMGRNRSMVNPVAMERRGLSRRTGAGLDPCAGLQVILKLAPGERAEITCMLGQAPSLEQVHALVLAYRDKQAVETALRQTQAWWDDWLGSIRVNTPELAADFMINRWLPYQNLVCRIWGRSAFYQSGGAFGFRDQLQDVMALLYAHPARGREHILLAASRQFTEGDVQHWWHPPRGEGIRSRISDDLLWLPFVVAQYMRVTGDVEILHEMVPFLEAPTLRDDEVESYQSPTVSPEQASLFEHCQRAVTRSQTFGVHGLPLMGTGDWNDGMNLVGAGGKGESVWLAWFLAEVLQGMSEMSERLGRPDLRQAYEQDRKALIRRVEQSAWDGEWYLRGTFDDGSPLGSKANLEARIDSLPQSWAWLGGGGDRDRAVQSLESAWRHLVLEDEGLVLLFEPPFDQAESSPGYIKGYPPGVRENGGQYTHAALWLAIAMARSGDGDRATKLLRMLNPIESACDPETVWRYGVEPYVIAADVYRLTGRTGHGGWSWYTGSAAWMYRAWIEEILGLKVRGETMQIDPIIPGWWDGFQLSYRHGEAIYEIQVENTEHRQRGVAIVELDGQRVEDGMIMLDRELVKHRVLVRMGESEPED